MIHAKSSPDELNQHARLWVWRFADEMVNYPPLARALFLKDIAAAALEVCEGIIADNPSLREEVEQHLDVA